MRYYCENCKSVIETIWEQTVCPKCVADQLYESLPSTYESLSLGYDKCIHEVPGYETVAQWEKRKREKYPDTAPVYCYYCDYGDGEEHWHCSTKDNWNASSMTLVVATEAGAPPDDWRPE